MSVHVISWVLRNSPETLGKRLVLIVLADHASEDGSNAWVSVATIGREARLSRSQVQRCLRALEVDGAIVKTGVHDSGTNVYTVLIQGPQNAAGPHPRRGGGLKMRPEPSLEQPSKDNPPAPTEPPPVLQLQQDVSLVYDYWRDARSKTRSNYDKISPARRQKIVTRLREFSAEQLMTAIAGVARDPWPDRKLHDDLTIIFRSREQVEKFLELAEGGGNGRGPARSARDLLDAADRLEAHDSR